MKPFQSALAAFLLLAPALINRAQSVPALVNYQGRLLNPDGTALATADYQLTFNIYDATNNGNLVWGPQVFDGQAAQGHGLRIPVVQGYFNVMLGPVDTYGASLASAFNATNRFVEITVSNHLPILPRQQILTAPFAFQAANSATLAGHDWSAILAGGSSNPETGKIAAAKLETGGITAGQIANGTITAQQIDSATWQLATNLNGGNAALASNVVSGIRITNAIISGDGSGLTNVVAAAVVAPPPGMALIPAGSFTMGNSIAADTDITDAAPTNVTVSAFYMDVNLVSWSQWQSVYYWATNHGYGFVNAGAGKAANHPVQTVDWYDCAKWCNARSQQAGKTPVYYTDAGLTAIYTNGEVTVYANWTVAGYRLPTEAEWEKAARGGLSGQRFPWGNVINQNLANYSGNTNSYSYDLGPNGYNAIGSVGGTSPATSPVGSFAANGYGLNDMAGNVVQWCWDWYGTPYGQPTTNNPTGPGGPLSYRLLRGGYWVNNANLLRCAFRDSSTPSVAYGYIGFRCVRGL